MISGGYLRLTWGQVFKLVLATIGLGPQISSDSEVLPTFFPGTTYLGMDLSVNDISVGRANHSSSCLLDIELAFFFNR